ncbi:MAG TPA: hypothetical protein VLD66_06635 [Methyloceanibacter sp.]|nr:hypothetical protein [Methyloceanibacter sp.]
MGRRQSGLHQKGKWGGTKNECRTNKEPHGKTGGAGETAPESDRQGDALYTPGRSIISGDGRPLDEQTALQIEELQAAIAEIDEELKGAA